MARILVVEDDIDMQDLYTEFLLKANHQALIASNGEEGLKKIPRFRPDLIILDMGMPRYNGLHLLLSLRRIDRNVPIIIVSGKVGMKDDIEIKLCTQVKAFLYKPVDLNALKKKIDEFIPSFYTVEKAVAEEDRNFITKNASTSCKPAISKSSSMIGSLLGGCKIECLLGEGGSGKVYRGLHLAMNMPVAIKVLSSDSIQDVNEINRFVREGRLLAQITHPNIVKIINMGHESNVYFIVMRYIESENLLNIIKAKKYIPYSIMLNITKQVCMGLSAVHDMNLVHRDIKPSNILLEKATGIAQIIDFGTVRGNKEDEKITEDGYIVGTPYYVSPEQCLGESVDKRSDIYSLGCSVFHGLVGYPPFMADNPMDTMISHVRDPIISPHSLKPEIPPNFSNIIVKMLQKKPQDRYGNMSEVLEDLDKVKLG
ncbi:MAG: protein kinase [Candidatus Brocadiae bacterium]|nr:protein kinase [Candidatus Brocadiia bacterium]